MLLRCSAEMNLGGSPYQGTGQPNQSADWSRAIVNQIFEWLVDEGLFEAEILSRLRGLGLRTDLGRPWCAAPVRSS